jgi:hypothetical protein
MSPKTLGSYFDRPHEHWKLNEVLYAADTPEFVFYRKRQSFDPPVRILPAAELTEIIPQIPVSWDGWSQKQMRLPVPLVARNRLVQLQIVSRSNTVQPLWVKADWLDAHNRLLDRVELKPHVYSTAAKDFYALKIPDSATTCDLALQVEKGVKRFELLDLQLIVD